MEQRTPEALLLRLRQILWQKRWALAGVWLAGLFAHGYMLANKLPNHDDLFHFWDKGAGLGSGRWLLPVVGWLDGNFSSPWMLGLLSLLLLSAAALLVVSVLQLKSPVLCFLAGAVLAVFPTVISLLAYMFTSDAYMLSFLLMVLSAWLCGRGGWRNRTAAVVCIILSLGLYQAFLGWAVALMMYALLDRCLEENAEVKTIFVDGLWDVGVLAAGVAGYICVTKLLWAVSEVGPSGYQNIGNMGRISLSGLPQQIANAYRMFFGVLWDTTYGIATTGLLRFLLTACQWLAILLIASKVIRQYRAGKRPEAALAALLGVLLPVGVNIICLMNASAVHTLMIYPMCMIPLVFLAECERWCAATGQGEKPAPNRLHTLGRWGCILLMTLLVFRYGRLANEVELQLQINHTRRLSYWTTIVTQIKSLPGYDQWLPVVLVKNGSDWDRTTPFLWKNVETMWDIEGARMPMHVYSNPEFLDLYLGFVTEFLNPDDYAGLPEVQAMPSYPADGSIRMVEKDDERVIVVKF